MATYHYRIIDKDARVRTGNIEAHFKWLAKRTLLGEDATILLLVPQDSLYERIRQIEIPIFGTGFGAMEEIMFYRNFSAMLGVGMPVSSALGVLAEQAKTRGRQKVVMSVRTLVESGKPLSGAMNEHPKYFIEHVTQTI